MKIKKKIVGSNMFGPSVDELSQELEIKKTPTGTQEDWEADLKKTPAHRGPVCTEDWDLNDYAENFYGIGVDDLTDEDYDRIYEEWQLWRANGCQNEPYDIYSSEDMFGQDDGFFTKDDIVELAEEVEFRLQEMTDQNFRYTDVYMDGSNVHVEITTPDDEAFTVSARIDMRKIRKPSDILKYTESLVNQFLNEYHGLEASTNIKCAEAFDEYADEIQEIDQEFTSENTSINSTKIPAVFKMVSFEPGTINIDYGGGKFDTAADYLTQYDVINLVYDPYNRSQEHNQEVIKTVRDAGGADTATCSNVLNVIKEPEVRLNILKNMKKLVKPGGDIYITVYEGTGKGEEGPTKSGYQRNKKTADYLEEIQQVFPDAKRKGKLISATNSGSSVESSTQITAAIEGVKSLEDELYAEAKEVMMSSNFGFDENEVDDYLFVEVNQDAEKTVAEVRAEISYDGMMELSMKLDPIVQKYDDDAYFDMEAPGIMTAYIRNLNSATCTTNISAAGEYWLDPPDLYYDDEEYEVDDIQIEIPFDDILVVDEQGDIDFESNDYAWLADLVDNKHSVYDPETEIYLDDDSGIADDCIELLYTYAPAQPGRYHLTCDITLVFDVTGARASVDYYDEGEERGSYYTEDVDLSDAEASFNLQKSTVENYKCDPE